MIYQPVELGVAVSFQLSPNPEAFWHHLREVFLNVGIAGDARVTVGAASAMSEGKLFIIHHEK